jgi:hypothetical protein
MPKKSKFFAEVFVLISITSTVRYGTPVPVLTKGTFKSVFKDNKILRGRKNCENQG